MTLEKSQPKAHAVLHYMKGLTESLQQAYRKHSVNLYSKAGLIVCCVVFNPEDPLDMEELCGVMYEYECDVCAAEYVGETQRSLGQRT